MILLTNDHAIAGSFDQMIIRSHHHVSKIQKSNTIMHVRNCKTPNRKIGSDTGSIWVDPGSEVVRSRCWRYSINTFNIRNTCNTPRGYFSASEILEAEFCAIPLTHVPQLAKPARYLIHPSISDERAQDDVAYSARRSLHIPPPYHRYSLSSSCALIPPRLGTR